MMYQALGLLSVLLLPVVVIYLFRQNNNLPASSTAKKSKKKKKKSKVNRPAVAADAAANPEAAPPQSASNATPLTEANSNDAKLAPREPVAATTSAHSGPSKTKKQPTNTKAQAAAPPSQSHMPLGSPLAKQDASVQQQRGGDEVDEHMDWEPKYARVMRITQEPEEEPWQQVPYERGWESVPVKNASSARPAPSSSMSSNEPLTKKQRANQNKAIKRREAKEAADALQAQRLRQHKKELERLRIEEFYSKGAGKHTPWGKKSKQQPGSSKIPTGRASLNEQGQLIWD
ncbi:hypothetical protein BX666DRAFT_1920149 [Dichotomocladium elegans]|nr:hypothetical protein BX666DRAFT_1920149 [Dichotomocladium elegans]